MSTTDDAEVRGHHLIRRGHGTYRCTSCDLRGSTSGTFLEQCKPKRNPTKSRLHAWLDAFDKHVAKTE